MKLLKKLNRYPESYEAFKKLGYKQKLTVHDSKERETLFVEYENTGDIINNISFCIEQRCIEISTKMNNNIHYFSRIDLNLLNAILIQCKELGFEVGDIRWQ